MSTWLITGCSTGLGRAFAEAVSPQVTIPPSPPATSARSPTSPKATPTKSSHSPSTSPTPHQVTDGRTLRPGAIRRHRRSGQQRRLRLPRGRRRRRRRRHPGTVRDSGLRCRRAAQGRAPRDACPPLRRHREHLLRSVSRSTRRAPATTPRPRPRSKLCPAHSTASWQPLGISVTVVEPGAFRTDFAGRSLTQSTSVIDDYADTAGKRRKEHDTATAPNPATQQRQLKPS